MNNAFLNDNLQEEVYIEQPPGYKQDIKYVCRLNKAIYGLKHALRVWFDKLKTTLISLSFQFAKSDNSLFIKNDKVSTIYILIYVDDLIITGDNDVEISNLIQ